MSDIVERLRAYNMGDFDTSAVLTKDCVSFADVPLIRDASDLVEVIHDAAAEIARLRERLEWDARHPRIDGIYCRDTTIEMQDAEIARLRAEVEALRAAGDDPPGAGLGERGA